MEPSFSTHAATMSLTNLTQVFSSKKQQLELLDQQRMELQRELLDLQQQIQMELDAALGQATVAESRSAVRSEFMTGRNRPRLSQREVHQVLGRAGVPLSYREIERLIRLQNPHCKLDCLRSILDRKHGPAVKVRSKWKVNENWVSKRGRPRINRT